MKTIMANRDSRLMIIQRVVPAWLFLMVTFCLIGILLNNWPVFNSVLLGSVFSLIGLLQMAMDQHAILIKKNKSRIFIGLIVRLMIYAIPVIIGLKFSNYFKFWVILVCLFKSQIVFILSEFVMNYRHYKKRMNNG